MKLCIKVQYITQMILHAFYGVHFTRWTLDDNSTNQGYCSWTRPVIDFLTKQKTCQHLIYADQLLMNFKNNQATLVQTDIKCKGAFMQQKYVIIS